MCRLHTLYAFVLTTLLLPAPALPAVHTDDVVFSLLRLSTDSDVTSMAVDGSSTAQHFDFSCTRTCRIYRINFYILDGSITYAKFGGLVALTNGVKITVVNKTSNAEILDFLDGYTIKDNADWTLLVGVDNTAFPAAGDDLLPIRWTLTNGIGQPLTLQTTEKLRVTIQDNLTDLTEFRAMVQAQDN